MEKAPVTRRTFPKWADLKGRGQNWRGTPRAGAPAITVCQEAREQHEPVHDASQAHVGQRPHVDTRGDGQSWRGPSPEGALSTGPVSRAAGWERLGNELGASRRPGRLGPLGHCQNWAPVRA